MNTEELLTKIKSLLLQCPSDFKLEDESARRQIRLSLYYVRQLSWDIIREIDKQAMREYIALANAILDPPDRYTVDDL